MAKGKASGGGVKTSRDVNRYQMPQGPTSLGNFGPGLGGTVRKAGSQGMTSCSEDEGGRAGLGGERKPQGSQR